MVFQHTRVYRHLAWFPVVEIGRLGLAGSQMVQESELVMFDGKAVSTPVSVMAGLTRSLHSGC